MLKDNKFIIPRNQWARCTLDLKTRFCKDNYKTQENTIDSFIKNDGKASPLGLLFLDLGVKKEELSKESTLAICLSSEHSYSKDCFVIAKDKETAEALVISKYEKQILNSRTPFTDESYYMHEENKRWPFVYYARFYKLINDFAYNILDKILKERIPKNFFNLSRNQQAYYALIRSEGDIFLINSRCNENGRYPNEFLEISNEEQERLLAIKLVQYFGDLAGFSDVEFA